MKTKTIRLKYITALLLAWPCLAQATLGDAPTTSNTAQKALKATLKAANPTGSATGTAFTVNTLQTEQGTTILEYVNPAGKVFAVSWSGPELPDLRVLLGTYFPELVSSSKVRHAGHSANLVNNPDLVVQSGGKPFAYTGRAWVPSLLPDGVSTDQIQ